MPIDVLVHPSQALASNPLNDPATRKLHVIVPEDHVPDRPTPMVWWLSGYGGLGRSMLSDTPWQEGLEERLVRLRREGKIGPMLVALPDAFTKWGGSQFISSTAHGDYETYLLDELRATVEARYQIKGHAIAGHSSGGFGAIVHAMRRPGLFDAVACHAGDMGFELAFTSDLATLMNAIHNNGGLDGLMQKFDAATNKFKFIGAMFVFALAAAYSPDKDAPYGVALPFDTKTGLIKPEIFERWLAWDPVNMIDEPACQESLRQMKSVFLDCGDRDEHHLQWGARAFSKKLSDFDVAHEYQEFPDGHRSTSYRLDVSLPILDQALNR